MSVVAASIIEVCVFKFEHNQPRYLLLHRSKDDKIYPGIWQFISGSIEGNETAVEAALRELSEETGFSPEAFWVVPHVSVFYDQSYDSMNLSPLFAAQVKAGSKPRLSPEHDEHRWFCLAEAKRTLVWPGLRQGLQIVHDYVVKGEIAARLTRIR